MYLGAEHLMGFLTVVPSAQWYSYLRLADMTGHDSSVQNSVMVPYNMLIWLKKSTAGHTIHDKTCTSQTHRQTDTQTDRQTDRQTDILLLLTRVRAHTDNVSVFLYNLTVTDDATPKSHTSHLAHIYSSTAAKCTKDVKMI